MVDPDNKKISVSRQCDLLGLNKSTFYYKPRGESLDNIGLMSLVDEIYTKDPHYGSRKIAKIVTRKTGVCVNRKRIQRIMRLLEISAIYPKPRTSIPNVQHKKYPYLMNNLEITGSNLAWCTDITYVRLEDGFAYLVAIMDWYSCRVISWRLSNTMDTSFCIEALREALKKEVILSHSC